MYHCNFCLKGSFKSAGAVSLHISKTAACKHQMERLRECEQTSKEATPRGDLDEPGEPMDVDGVWDLDDGLPDGNNDNREGPQRPLQRQDQYVGLEEVEDEERTWMRFIHSFPGQVAQKLGQAETMFQDIRAQQEAQGLDPWAPFTDEEEWGLVKWLVSRVGHTAIDEFLKLPIVSQLHAIASLGSHTHRDID